MGVWEQLKGELATSSGDDLERLMLPLGRLFWPNLVRVPRRKDFDQAGVDLAVIDDGNELSTVVQCKGFFSDRRLTDSHYKQIEESLDKFAGSPLRCHEFVLFHNQTGENVEITRKIRARLELLVASGKAATIRLWDRQTIVRDAKSRLDKAVADRLREETALLLAQVNQVFRFGGVHVSNVPFSEHRLTLLRHESPKIELVRSQAAGAIADLLFSRSESQWTLLTGLFGSGKSTSALHAALAARDIVVFVRCADLEFEHGFAGTNALLRRVTQSLRLFDDYDDEDRKALEIYSGPTLRSALSRPDSGAVLILDGLDENRMFSDSAGMTRLVNALAELRCPIVLTTRQEHFDATYGNFEEMLNELAKTRTARLFKLEAWRQDQTIEFLSSAAASATESERARLADLASALGAGELCKWPEELLGHPLFLQMISDLTAEGETPLATVGAVLGTWIERKIVRDLKVPRALPKAIDNRTAFAEGLMSLMEDVAAAMTETTSEGLRLRETIESATVVKMAATAIGVADIDIASLTSISLLVPVTQRRKSNVPMRFSHRVFQEYFTACHARHVGLAPGMLPPPVARLMAELDQIEAP